MMFLSEGNHIIGSQNLLKSWSRLDVILLAAIPLAILLWIGGQSSVCPWYFAHRPSTLAVSEDQSDGRRANARMMT